MKETCKICWDVRVMVIGAESEICEPSSNSDLVSCVHFVLYPCKRHEPISSPHIYGLNNRLDWSLCQPVYETENSELKDVGKTIGNHTAIFPKSWQFTDINEKEAVGAVIVYLLKKDGI